MRRRQKENEKFEIQTFNMKYNTQCIIQSVFVISSSTPHGDRPTRNEPPVARKENGRAPLVTLVLEEPLATLKGNSRPPISKLKLAISNDTEVCWNYYEVLCHHTWASRQAKVSKGGGRSVPSRLQKYPAQPAARLQLLSISSRRLETPARTRFFSRISATISGIHSQVNE